MDVSPESDNVWFVGGVVQVLDVRCAGDMTQVSRDTEENTVEIFTKPENNSSYNFKPLN